MKKYLRYFTFILITGIAVASCKKDDAAQNSASVKLIQSSIAGVNGPVSGKVNQELVFNLIWQNTDATAKFDHVQDSTLHNTKIVRLFSLTNAADTISLKDHNSASYKFKAAAAGTYYLKFYKADNLDKNAIIDTLVIK